MCLRNLMRGQKSSSPVTSGDAIFIDNEVFSMCSVTAVLAALLLDFHFLPVHLVSF